MISRKPFAKIRLNEQKAKELIFFCFLECEYLRDIVLIVQKFDFEKRLRTIMHSAVFCHLERQRVGDRRLGIRGQRVERSHEISCVPPVAIGTRVLDFARMTGGGCHLN